MSGDYSGNTPVLCMYLDHNWGWWSCLCICMYGDEVMKEENLGNENGLLYLQNLVKKLHIV